MAVVRGLTGLTGLTPNYQPERTNEHDKGL